MPAHCMCAPGCQANWVVVARFEIAASHACRYGRAGNSASRKPLIETHIIGPLSDVRSRTQSEMHTEHGTSVRQDAPRPRPGSREGGSYKWPGGPADANGS